MFSTWHVGLLGIYTIKSSSSQNLTWHFRGKNAGKQAFITVSQHELHQSPGSRWRLVSDGTQLSASSFFSQQWKCQLSKTCSVRNTRQCTRSRNSVIQLIWFWFVWWFCRQINDGMFYVAYITVELETGCYIYTQVSHSHSDCTTVLCYNKWY
jgi:hypothetical protein